MPDAIGTFTRGARITTLKELYEATLDHRSVVVPGTVWHNPRAAAFLMNLQGHILHRLFVAGMFLYEPKTRKKFHEAVKKAGEE